ncbi:MAG TPA: hypothetical protein VG500_03415 [Gemmatimonadales bacterium]|jgi:hypothetical protein|nr:hypothetical protein [Gemmatimonadales bacterium]
MTTILRFTCCLGVAFAVAAPAVPAQEAGAASPAKACAATEHRQFDFWIGDWDVTTPAGAMAGRNRIEPILGGCVLKESWTGARGMSGSSYNAYDRQKKQWHQTWVDDNGSLLQLDGKFADGKMVLSGETRDTSGAPVLNRITWQETEPGVVRQLWETSGDGGKSWSVAFDGRYRKRR